MANRPAIGMPRGDAVVHDQATRFDLLMQYLKVRRQIGMPHMLEHADTDDLVVVLPTRQIAIVAQLQLNTVAQPLGCYPLAGEFQLLPAEGNAVYLNPVFFRRVTGQPSPTAANIQQPLAAAQAELATEMVQLLHLSPGEGIVRMSKVAA